MCFQLNTDCYGAMEYWSDGILEYWKKQNSTTPIHHSSNAPTL